MKVRKKNDIVNAWYYDEDSRHYVISILDVNNQNFMPFGKDIILYTKDGELTISPGDYVIQGKMGNFYNCKEDVFNENYEIVTENYE